MDASILTDLAHDPFVQTGVLATACALVTHVLLRRYPAGRLIFQFVFFAGLTALLYHHDIVPYVIAPGDTPAFQRIFLALGQDHLVGQCGLGADELHAHLPDLRKAAA